MNTLIIILTIILVAGFVYLGVTTFIARRGAQQENLNQSGCVLSELPVNIVHAGSDKDCTLADHEIILNPIKAIQFKDRNGNVLNPTDYDLYIVAGECMQYVNIHPDDLLFATKGFEVEKYKGNLPIILIIKKGTTDIKKGTTTINVPPFYKLRRLWKVCNYRDDFNEILKSIIQSPEFQEVRRRPNYDGDKALIEDFFDVRLKRYEEEYIKCEFPNINDEKIVISTTFHTDIQRVRFSIHPVSNVVGKVEAAFPIESNYITWEKKAV